MTDDAMAYSATPMHIDEHRDAVQKLWYENLSDARIRAVAPARMRWFYEDNPAGAASTWLGVHDESHEIVGSASFFPRTMYVHGRPARAGVLSDFVVAKAHRIAGAAIVMQRALAKSSAGAGFEFLYGYPNRGAAPVCKRVGYKTLGETTNWVKPLRSAYKVRQRVSHPLAVQGLSFAIDLGLAAMDLARSLGRPRRFEGEITEKADESFDELWERVRSRYDIVGERTALYLNWRYAAFTTEKHFFYRLRDKELGRLAGYLVYAEEGDKVVIKDVFCEDLETTAGVLLVMVSQHLRSQGRASLSLSYIGPEAFGKSLRRAGFFRRPGSRPLVAYVPPGAGEEARREICETRNWFMIEGELDI